MSDPLTPYGNKPMVTPIVNAVNYEYRDFEVLRKITDGEIDGYDFVAVVVEGTNRHPGGMAGGAPAKLKLVFEKNTGVLLGGQARGNESVGEIINIVSACIQKKMLAEDIATFQMGTHPALTASPIAYHLVSAAELAIRDLTVPRSSVKQ